MFVLREHQQYAVSAALSKPAGGTLTAVIPPGGGKTILALAVLDALHKAGRIDAAIVFTPRLGLCSQFELDWKSVRDFFQPNALNEIVHRENASIDSLRSFGYVTSYQSLTADSIVHRRFARRRAGRLAIVCDEAHYLGQKLYGSGETTEAAKVLANIGKYAAFKLVMTGTPYRSDENPIVFAEYDDDGNIRADVKITYSDGVAQGFLRPFDAILFDGTLYQTRRRQRDSASYYSREAVDLRFTAQQLTKVATDPQFWQVAARHAFEKVKELQELWPRYCGIAGCATQDHAREVMAYLESLGARCLLAVSDDSNAHENLRLFKRGGWDMLVTVGMAHVGYDYKPIAVAAVLNGVREYNWLDQFTMRAGRVVPGRPRAEQTAWVYGLNDRAMRQYVNAKRREAERAVKMRADEEDPTQGSNLGGGGLGPQLLYNGVELEGISGIGFDHNGYLAELEEEDDEFAHLTDKEKREALRRRRQGLANQYAAKLYGSVNGETIRKANGLLIARYGKSVNQCTPEELAEQIVWLENELGLNAESVQVQEDTYEEEPFFVQQGLFGDDEMMG
ncbi:MAG: DEAD/DEAH box helicase family protein [Caldilineaceae bacterium]